MSTFTLPDLGEGLMDAEIVSWHVSVGDHVVADQPLVSVETAKAVVEIPSPQSGFIAEIYGKTGDVIEIGAQLVAFSDEKPGDPGAIVGDLPKSDEPTHHAKPAKPSKAKAMPAVQRLADKLAVDLSTIKGTGPEGSITSKDVENAARPKLAGVEIKTLKGVRREMARSMTKSGAEIVPTTVMDEADINHWPDDRDITLSLIRAIQAGVKAEPDLNSWYHPGQNEHWVHKNIQLGMAIDTPQGLFNPVLANIASHEDESLRKELKKLQDDLQSRAIAPQQLQGQTFTLSNFGMIGGQHATLTIIPPQVAILGAGRVTQQVVLEQQGPATHRFLPLSLTFDHRIITGGQATRFLAAVIAALEAK